MKKLLWIVKSILYIITTSIFLLRILSVNALAVDNYQFFPSPTEQTLINEIETNAPSRHQIPLPTSAWYYSSNVNASYLSNAHNQSTYLNVISQNFFFQNTIDSFNLQKNKEYHLTLYIGVKQNYNPLTSIIVNTTSSGITTTGSYYKKVEPRLNPVGHINEYRYDIYFKTNNNISQSDTIYISMKFNPTSLFQSGLMFNLYRTYNIEEVVENNNQELIGAVNDVDDSIKNQTDLIKDTDSSQAINSAGGFFEGFTTDTYGLTSVITAPLVMINNLVSSNCVAIPLELIGYDFSLPCIDSLIPSAFSPLLTIYRVATDAIIGYWVMVNILALVKGFKDPEKDNIEVLEL